MVDFRSDFSAPVQLSYIGITSGHFGLTYIEVISCLLPFILKPVIIYNYDP